MAIELHDVIEKHRNDPAASTHVLSAAVFWNETLLAGMSVSCDLALPPVESHVRTGFLTREGRLIEGKPIEQGTARSTEGAS
jgi:hypothetical protein